MKLLLDEYCYLDSCIHRWQCKPKLIALFTLIICFAFIQNLLLLPLIIIPTFILYFLSNLPLKFILSRLRYPGIFIAGVIIVLPFLVGETSIFSLGFLSIKQEGCLLVILIVTRFMCILTTTLVILGTSSFLTILKTLKSLGLSPILGDMMLLTYRYLEQLGDRTETMERALKLKGFNIHKYNRRNLTIIANLIGSLLVRSYDDSKLVYQAMILRGYGYKIDKGQTSREKIPLTHWLACYGIVIMGVSIVIVQGKI